MTKPISTNQIIWAVIIITIVAIVAYIFGINHIIEAKNSIDSTIYTNHS